MSTVKVSGLSSYKEPEPLMKAWYTCVITEARAVNEGRFAVNYMVTDGPTQPDGEDPAGRKFSDFFTTSGYENHKDKGKFATAQLARFLAACGVDVSEDEFELEELADKEISVFVKAKPDLDGFMRENGVRYAAVD